MPETGMTLQPAIPATARAPLWFTAAAIGGIAWNRFGAKAWRPGD
jgi:hypothetical protein